MCIKVETYGNKRKKDRGEEKGKTSEFWGLLSLWWIDRENRVSQKERCKNRIAPLSLDTSPLCPFTQSQASPPSRSLPSPMTPPPRSSSSPLCALVLRCFLDITSQHPPSSVSIYSSAYTYTQRRQKTKPLHPTGLPLHHTQLKRFLKFLLHWSPDDTPIQYTLTFLWKTHIYAQGLSFYLFMSFYLSCLTLLCIHAAAQIQHIQTSGLWGILMEAIQNTTYCLVCLKCSTSQTALRPLRKE